MAKTLEELAEEFAKINGRFNRLDSTCLYLRNAFLVGYKTAQKEYEAKIKELETELDNWQHTATHGDKGI
jgi:hypothetical protein